MLCAPADMCWAPCPVPVHHWPPCSCALHLMRAPRAGTTKSWWRCTGSHKARPCSTREPTTQQLADTLRHIPSSCRRYDPPAHQTCSSQVIHQILLLTCDALGAGLQPCAVRRQCAQQGLHRGDSCLRVRNPRHRRRPLLAGRLQRRRWLLCHRRRHRSHGPPAATPSVHYHAAAHH